MGRDVQGNDRAGQLEFSFGLRYVSCLGLKCEAMLLERLLLGKIERKLEGYAAGLDPIGETISMSFD